MNFRGIAALFAALMLVGNTRPSSAVEVELELMLAVDVSTSVDDREFELQRQGLAAAFLHPDVVRAVRNVGPGGVAVSLIYWAGTYQQQVAVDWMHLRNAQDAARFSTAITGAPREITGLTGISGAIRFSVESLLNNVFFGRRRTIDVSGDGTGSNKWTIAARDAALAAGITINGLVIYSDDHDLGVLAHYTLRDFYANHVIGGPGAFLMAANDFEDFQTAIRRKLVREIIGVFAAQNDLTGQ